MKLLLPHLSNVGLIITTTLHKTTLLHLFIFLIKKATLVGGPFKDFLFSHLQNILIIFLCDRLDLVMLNLFLPGVRLSFQSIRSEKIQNVIQGIENELVVDVLSFQGSLFLRTIMQVLRDFEVELRV